jgi:intracellular sulfur oxidation DsrE/DsrF family protein
MDVSRYDFVASAASAAVSVRVAARAPSPAAQATSHPSLYATVPFAFDRDAFFGSLNQPYAHRQVSAPNGFAAATVAMSHAKNALRAYADPNGFAGGPNSLHCASVLYAGRSMNLAFDDAMYAKYPLGLLNDEEIRPNDVSNRKYSSSLNRNPMDEFLRPLFIQGLSVFVCNNALSGLAAELAKRMKGDAATRADVVAIHSDLASHFQPNTMLVPAGVGALIAAQEARFTFLP